jgi:hypothetical protein
VVPVVPGSVVVEAPPFGCVPGSEVVPNPVVPFVLVEVAVPGTVVVVVPLEAVCRPWTTTTPTTHTRVIARTRPIHLNLAKRLIARSPA